MAIYHQKAKVTNGSVHTTMIRPGHTYTQSPNLPIFSVDVCGLDKSRVSKVFKMNFFEATSRLLASKTTE